MTISYGWAVGVTDECCIASPTDQARMLCGRQRGYVPNVPPPFPARVCAECQRRWEQRGLQPEPVLDPYGTCPECGGHVPLAADLVGAHGKWRRTRHGERFTDEPCPGKGMEPEALA